MENMDNSGMASNSSHRYDQLLKTVGSLQGDLQRTLGVCQTLKSENQTLKKNFDAMKAEVLRIREKYNTARREAVGAIEAKMATEKEVDALIAGWEAQLHRKVLEYEELQKKLAPQDINALKVDLKEEMEREYDQKKHTLEGEAEKWRQMFYNVRREYEKIKTEYGQFSADSGKEMELLHTQAKAETQQLRVRISELETALMEANKDDELRRSQRRVEQAEIQRQEIEDELVQVRKEKAALEMATLKDRTLHQQTLAEHHTARAGLEADRQALQRQVISLESDISRQKGLAEEAQLKIQSLRDDVQKLRHQVEDRDHLLLTERQKSKEELSAVKKGFLEEKLELENIANQSSKKAESAEQQAKEAQSNLEQQLKEKRNLEIRLTKASREKVAALQEEIEKLQKDLLYMRDKVREAEDGKRDASQQVLNDLNLLRAEKTKLQREKEILQDKVNFHQTDIGKNQSEINKMRFELNEEVAQHRATKEQLRNSEDNLRLANNSLEEMTLRLKYVEEELRSHNEEVRMLKDQQAKKLVALHKKSCQEKENILNKAKQDMDSLKLKSKKILKKEQKRSAAYKQKALETYEIAKQKSVQISALQQASLEHDYLGENIGKNENVI